MFPFRITYDSILLKLPFNFGWLWMSLVYTLLQNGGSPFSCPEWWVLTVDLNTIFISFLGFDLICSFGILLQDIVLPDLSEKRGSTI